MKRTDEPGYSSGDIRLIVRQGSLAGQEFALKGTAVLVGRGAHCDVVLQEQLVSREHARFQPGPQGWMVTDLGSTNGTLLNGQPLQPNQAYLLQPGDQVTIGQAVLAIGQTQPGRPVPGRATSRTRPAARPGRLIAAILVVVAVLVALVVVLVIVLQPEEETTGPQPLEELPLGTALPLPTILDSITTALPTQLQDLTTALPIPTQLEPMATSFLTSFPTGLPNLPGLATATPAPAAALNQAPPGGEEYP